MSGLAPVGVSAGTAFLAGALSIASPCVMPLVPAYLAAVTGYGLAPVGARLRRRTHAALFILTLGVVYGCLGAFAGVTATMVSAPTQARIAGLVLCATGLAGLGLLPAVGIVRRLPGSMARRGSPVVLGIALSLVAAPCTTTLLGLTLTAAMTAGSATGGTFVLAAYGAGVAAALFAVGAAFTRAASSVRAVRRHLVGVSRASAGVTATIGTVLALGQGWRLDVVASRLLDALRT